MEERVSRLAGSLGEQVFGLSCSVNVAVGRLGALERKVASPTVACGGCQTPLTFETGR
jgi:hypothetical protein